MPFFSIIIPCYNRANLIEATIDSVLAQSFSDYEIIVVDDGSQDESLIVLSRYGAKIKVIKQENSGPGAARNNGLKHANGLYVAFLDSDDLWFPWTLETYKDVIDEHNGPSIVTAPCEQFVTTLELLNVPRLPLDTKAYPSFLRSPMKWCVPSGFTAKAEVLVEVGGFAESAYEDVEVWLRIGAAPGVVNILAPVCFGYRNHLAGVSKTDAYKLNGIKFLIRSEQAPCSSDNREVRRRRREFICQHVRPASLQFLESGHLAEAIGVYLQTLRWHLCQGRLRYVFGFPWTLLRTALFRMRSGRAEAAAAP